MAIALVCAEEADLNALEARPGFAGMATPLRFGTDPLYSTVDSPQLRGLLQHWNVDGATIPPTERVSDVILLLLRVANPHAMLRNWLIAEMSGEQGVD